MTGDKVIVNDQTVWEASPETGLTGLYKELGLEYPKFYKMDQLSQAAFLAVELLLQAAPALKESADDGVALLFANAESSSATDARFRKSYEEDRLPSPSLFVYTLPNIALGEIAIRNKWYGEHMFGFFPNFTPDFYMATSEIMLQQGSEAVIGGWLNVRDQRDVLVFVLWAAPQEGAVRLTEATLNNLMHID